ncbi:hypothetical protein [Acidipila rosea]|uniref:Uncharacterized protein n=1 Tax=Acidipila rosea TaxID=768535 RepID=A0A4R1LBW0_9BACT|nr:hypothetical protein [Acidipila rosea]TCK75047.1 hypothetical protein C7378_0026 [Acidipila rosea]
MATYPRFYLAQYPEVEQLLRERKLQFPIPTKSEFIEQMTSRGEPVMFRNVAYDPHFAADLMPEFFFPVLSEEDMLQKGVELMIARGLFPAVQPST